MLLLLLVIISISLFYAYAKYKQTYWSRRGVYSPPANWLFGHFSDVFALKASAALVLRNMHKAYENQPDRSFIGVYMFQKPFLLVRDPKLIKQILIKDFEVFPNRSFAAKIKNDEIFRSNLLSSSGSEWKYLRSKLSPAFSTDKLKRLFNLMVAKADGMLKHLDDRVPDDQSVTVEVKELYSKFTVDVLSSLTLGISTDSYSKPEFHRKTGEILKPGIIRSVALFANFLFPWLNKLIGGTMLGKHESYFRHIFWDSMEQREKSDNLQKGDMIDSIINLKNSNQDSEYNFEGDRLLAQPIMPMIAGYEGTSVALAFALHELAKNPEIQEEVRREIREKIPDGDGEITYEQLNEMKAVQQVVNEILRMYPSAPFLDRTALRDYKIPNTNVTIEKGTAVYIAMDGLHHDSEHYKNPMEFDPSRFSDERKHDIKPFTFLPFGEGPRVCIGKRIGIILAMVGLATVLNRYKVSINPNFTCEVSKRATFTAPVNGIHLYFDKLK